MLSQQDGCGRVDEKKGRKTKAGGSSVVEPLGGPGFHLPCSEKGDRGRGEKYVFMRRRVETWTELSSVSETPPH